MALPCPDKNLVVECTIKSAPCSKGLQRYGVANVLSTMNGTLCFCAIVDNICKSEIDPPIKHLIESKMIR